MEYNCLKAFFRLLRERAEFERRNMPVTVRTSYEISWEQYEFGNYYD